MFHEIMLTNNFFTFKLSHSGAKAVPQFLYSNVFLEEIMAHNLSFLCNASMNYKHKLFCSFANLWWKGKKKMINGAAKCYRRRLFLSDVRMIPEGKFHKLLFVVVPGDVKEENEYLPYTYQEIMNIRYLDTNIPSLFTRSISHT